MLAIRENDLADEERGKLNHENWECHVLIQKERDTTKLTLNLSSPCPFILSILLMCKTCTVGTKDGLSEEPFIWNMAEMALDVSLVYVYTLLNRPRKHSSKLARSDILLLAVRRSFNTLKFELPSRNV